MAAHGAKRNQQLREHFGTVATSHAVIVQNHDLVVLRQNLGKLGHLLGLHAANGFSPLRRLRHAIVFAKNVVLQVLVDGLVFRHAFRIETNRVLMQEVPIDNAALFLVKTHHLIGHSEHECHVRARAHGHPLGIEHLGRRVVQRVDRHELRALVARVDPVVDRRARRRPSRVGRPHDDVVGVLKVETVVGRVGLTRAAVGHRKAHLRHIERVRTVRRGVPTAHIAGQHVERGVVRLTVETGRAILVGDALDLFASKFNGLIPADDFPFVFAAHLAVRFLAATGLPALALQRVQDAVGAKALLLLSLATHATALLRVLDRILVRVVGLLTHHGAVLDHDLVHATAAAVVPACRRNPFAALCRVDGHFVLIDSFKTRLRRATGCG